MNTLADEFLADLGEDLEEKEDESKEQQDEEEDMSIENLHYTDTKQLAAFVYGHRLRDLVEVKLNFLSQFVKRVQERLVHSDFKKELRTPGNEEGDYALVVEANNMCVEISEEITKINYFIKEHYKKKFPELDSLILNPLDYARVVLKIGNEMVCIFWFYNLNSCRTFLG